MQLAGEALPLFERRRVLGRGEEARVLHRHRRLVGDGAQKDALVLAGFLSGQVVEVDGAQSPSPEEFFSETQFPASLILGTIALSYVEICVLRGL